MPQQADSNVRIPAKRLCPFFSRPFPDCHCVNMTSLDIPQMLKYCHGHHSDCTVFLSHTRENEPEAQA